MSVIVPGDDSPLKDKQSGGSDGLEEIARDKGGTKPIVNRSNVAAAAAAVYRSDLFKSPNPIYNNDCRLITRHCDGQCRGNVASFLQDWDGHSLVLDERGRRLVGVVRPLLLAVQYNALRVLQALLKLEHIHSQVDAPHVFVSTLSDNGEQALNTACRVGSVDAVATFLKEGAHPDKKSDKCTPLFHAVNDKSIPMAELLLNAGANPDKCSSTGKTPLYRAVENNHLQMVELLLNAGADPYRTALVVGCHAPRHGTCRRAFETWRQCANDVSWDDPVAPRSHASCFLGNCGNTAALRSQRARNVG